jgi:uncharacterized alkaline shock family protein YloU
MENNGYARDGSLKISEEVISTIASIATTEIKGVAGLSPRPNSDIRGILRSKKGVKKGIGLETKDGEAIVDIYVSIYHGVRIPDVAGEIQVKVKDALQNMTGITVSKVNVHITGLSLNKETGIDY